MHGGRRESDLEWVAHDLHFRLQEKQLRRVRELLHGREDDQGRLAMVRMAGAAVPRIECDHGLRAKRLDGSSDRRREVSPGGCGGDARVWESKENQIRLEQLGGPTRLGASHRRDVGMTSRGQQTLAVLAAGKDEESAARAFVETPVREQRRQDRLVIRMSGNP